MSWNIEGAQVEGYYLETYFVTGKVVESRVKYGGRVQHKVELDYPIVVFGTERDVVLLGDDSITRCILA